MTNLLKVAAISSLTLLTISPVCAAPQEVVGTYNGTLTFKSYNVVTGVKSSGKTSAVLVVNANDTYTLGLNNFTSFGGSGIFGASVGAIRFEDAFQQVHSTLHFKGSAAKGTFLHTGLTGDKTVMEAKLSLKRE